MLVKKYVHLLGVTLLFERALTLSMKAMNLKNICLIKHGVYSLNHVLAVNQLLAMKI